nr:hypothetical protein [Tanacetum cinerariifolium]
MLNPLGGCDMVLGVQWLSTLGDINCNFKNLTMKFNYQGKKIMLRGSQSGGLQWIQAQLMQIQRGTAESSNDNLPLQHLLRTYNDVFAMPTELPPPRTHDHAITLLPNTLPVTVRPYRLPPNQKDVVVWSLFLSLNGSFCCSLDGGLLVVDFGGVWFAFGVPIESCTLFSFFMVFPTGFS